MKRCHGRCQIANRLGAENVYIVYRRSEKELLKAEKCTMQKEEESKFRLLNNPVRILGQRRLCQGMECIRMELGEPDASGRRRPFRFRDRNCVGCRNVIIAIDKADPLDPKDVPELCNSKMG